MQIGIIKLNRRIFSYYIFYHRCIIFFKYKLPRRYIILQIGKSTLSFNDLIILPSYSFLRL